MSQPRPVYLFSPGDPGPLPAGFAVGDVERVHHVDELRDRAPGLLLLPVAGLEAADLLRALGIAAAASSPAWLPVLIEAGEGGAVAARPVSLGWPVEPTELARWVRGDDEAHVLELREVLNRVARGRHDINNPLTSAMAETQLALMDTTEPELRAGLETIEEQLRRIRDLVAALRVLRPPR